MGLSFSISNEMFNRGWIAEGVKASDVEHLIQDAFERVEDEEIEGPYFVRMQTDDYFEVVRSGIPDRRIARFYGWPQISTSRKRAKIFANELNKMESNLDF